MSVHWLDSHWTEMRMPCRNICHRESVCHLLHVLPLLPAGEMHQDDTLLTAPQRQAPEAVHIVGMCASSIDSSWRPCVVEVRLLL